MKHLIIVFTAMLLRPGPAAAQQDIAADIMQKVMQAAQQRASAEAAQGKTAKGSFPSLNEKAKAEAARLRAAFETSIPARGYRTSFFQRSYPYKTGDSVEMGQVVDMPLKGGLADGLSSELAFYVMTPEASRQEFLKRVKTIEEENSGRIAKANRLEKQDYAWQDILQYSATVVKRSPDRFLYGELSADVPKPGKETVTKFKGAYKLLGYSGATYYEFRFPVDASMDEEGNYTLNGKPADSPDGFGAPASLDDKELLYFGELLAFERVIRGSDAPPWGGKTPAAVYVTLNARSYPSELRPKPGASCEIVAEVLERPEDSAISSPKSGLTVTFALKTGPGLSGGALSAASATTGPDGRARVVYTPPAEPKEDRAAVAVMTDGAGEETAYVDLLLDKAVIRAYPSLEGSPFPTAVIPADGRFPAVLSVTLEDRDGRPLPGERVAFALDSKKPRGTLRGPDGETGTVIGVLSGADGVARVTYRYEGPRPENKPWLEAVNISSKFLPRAKKAYISAGMSLEISGIRDMYEGKGKINAGETVPFIITVKDSFHPQVKDLSPFFRHWTGNSDGAPPLGVKLLMTPEGNAPDYFTDQLALKYAPNRPFDDFVAPRYMDRIGETVLWVTSGQDYTGAPRITPRFTGANYFSARAALCDLSTGKPLDRGSGRKSYITLNAGLAADAGKIFLLEDPFGPHTREAVFFRTVLDMAGFGAALDLTAAATLANKGDVEGLARMAASMAAGKLTALARGSAEKLVKSGVDLAGDEAAKVYAAITLYQEAEENLAALGDLAGAAMGTSPGGEDSPEKIFAEAIISAAGLKDKRLVAVSGAPLTGPDGRPLVAPEDGRLTISDDGRAAVLKTGGKLFYLLPSGG